MVARKYGCEMMDRVLITGLSGFIASHVAAKLLDKGYHVRGTVRNLEKGERIIGALKAAGHAVENVELVEADLSSRRRLVRRGKRLPLYSTYCVTFSIRYAASSRSSRPRGARRRNARD